jgi:hypothetical protein
MSPFCPGRTLSDCPSSYAAEWRQDIRVWIAEGLSTEEIRKRLEQRLPEGAELSGAPDTGLGWALPVGLSLGAVLLVGIILRRLRNREDDAKPPRPSSKSGADDDASEAASDGEAPDAGDLQGTDGPEPSGAHSATGGSDDRSGPRASARNDELERRLDEELQREE